MNLKTVFNWGASYSNHKFTLGEARHRIKDLFEQQPLTPGQSLLRTAFRDMDWLNRSGRMAERAVTLTAAFKATTIGFALGGVVGAATAFSIMSLGKIAGLTAGFLTHGLTSEASRRLNKPAA